MLLRDPVHGLVSYEGDFERVALALLDTREVQRLRRVRQLGLTSLVFPGAEHSRFAHALGAAHVMTRLLEHVTPRQSELPPSLRLDPMHARDAFAAAMLHDLGHGPFSHLFEEVMPNARPHEAWTTAMIVDPSTEISAALRALDPGMPARVAALIEGEHALPWLASAVSGTLDVDRCDYLLRDSHMTGVAYGIYDLDWLLRSLAFAKLERRPESPAEPGRHNYVASAERTPPADDWVLAIEGRKGLPPIEGFFLARHFMYQQVYHHKATRGAECLVRGLFKRAAELVREGRAPDGTPDAVAHAVVGDPPSLPAYVELDDVRLMHCLACWEKESDPVLADLATRFRRRALPKTVPLPEGEGAEAKWQEAHARASEVVTAMGLRADLHVWLDVAEDVPYEEPRDASRDGLWVTIRHQPLRRLGDISFALERLRNVAVVRPRLCFPREARDAVVAAIEPVLG
jgi:HD superfamily phosphohydrolase